MKISQLNFWNAGHNGDIFYSKEFVKELHTYFNLPSVYYHNAKIENKLFIDCPNINHKPLSFDKDLSFLKNEYEYYYDENTESLFINTWVGSSHFNWIPRHIAVCLNASYNKFSYIYNHTSCSLKESYNYIPRLDWSLYETSKVDNFFKKHNFLMWVLICNGDALSGQSNNFSFFDIIKHLSISFPNVGFIMTDKKDFIPSNNIFYTEDIIELQTSDLIEISYLSKNTNIIIGRASGPFCFTHIIENLENTKKVFISFSNLVGDAIWAAPENLKSNQATQLWYCTYDVLEIINILNEELKKQVSFYE